MRRLLLTMAMAAAIFVAGALVPETGNSRGGDTRFDANSIQLAAGPNLRI